MYVDFQLKSETILVFKLIYKTDQIYLSFIIFSALFSIQLEQANLPTALEAY